MEQDCEHRSFVSKAKHIENSLPCMLELPRQAMQELPRGCIESCSHHPQKPEFPTGVARFESEQNV
jgi:hypothetical protein